MGNGMLSDHDMIVTMYTELVGLGNGGGVLREHHILKQDVSTIKTKLPKLVRHEYCEKARTDLESKNTKEINKHIVTKERRKAYKLSIIHVIIMAVGIIAGIVIKLLLGG